MARCILSAYIDHDYLERLDAEATRRGLSRAALAREVLHAAFPPPKDMPAREPAPTSAGDDE